MIFFICGTSFQLLIYSQNRRADIFGGYLPVDSTQPSWRTRVSSKVLPSLLHGRKFGSPGHHLNVGSSCGLLRTTRARQQINLHVVGCLSWNAVHFVFKMMKLSTISWSATYLLGNFGLFYQDSSIFMPYPHKLWKTPFLIGGKELVMLLLSW